MRWRRRPRAPRRGRGSGGRAGRGAAARRSGAARPRPDRPAARASARPDGRGHLAAQDPGPAAAAGPGEALVPRQAVVADREERRALAHLRAPTTPAASSGGRYMRWWLLMAPTTGPCGVAEEREPPVEHHEPVAARPAPRPARARAPGGTAPTRRARPVASRAAPARDSQAKPPAAGSASRPVAHRQDVRRTRRADDRARRAGPRRATAPAATAKAAPGVACGVAGGVIVSQASTCWAPSTNSELARRAPVRGRDRMPRGSPRPDVSTGAVSGSVGSRPGPYDGSETRTDGCWRSAAIRRL